MSCSNQIICYTSPHLSLHVPFFFLLIILTHCYVIVYSFYYPPLQAYLQYKKSLSNIIHLSHRQIQIFLTVRYIGIWRFDCRRQSATKLQVFVRKQSVNSKSTKYFSSLYDLRQLQNFRRKYIVSEENA